MLLLKKTYAFIRWIFYSVFIAGIFTILAWIFYPLAYVLRKTLRSLHRYSPPPKFLVLLGLASLFGIPLIYRAEVDLSFFILYIFLSLIYFVIFILWILLNDECEYGCIEPGWFETHADLSTPWKRFVTSYKWAALRNPAWNMYQIFRPREGEEIKVSASGELRKNGRIVKQSEFAVLKWQDWDGNFQGNKGDFISKKFSILGEMKYWYTINGSLYFRYSKAVRVESAFWIFICRLLLHFFEEGVWKQYIWLEVHLGSNDRRFTIRVKIKSGLLVKNENGNLIVL